MCHHVGHLTAEVEQRLHGVAGDLQLADVLRAFLFERPLGDRIADGTGLLEDGDLEVGLEHPSTDHQAVAVDHVDVGKAPAQRLDERDARCVDAEPTAVEPTIPRRIGRRMSLTKPSTNSACSMIWMDGRAIHDMPR